MTSRPSWRLIMSTVESVPSSLKQLRACLLCSLVICLFLLLACFSLAICTAHCLGDEDDHKDLRYVARYRCLLNCSSAVFPDLFLVPLLACYSMYLVTFIKCRSSQEDNLRVTDVTTVNRYLFNNLNFVMQIFLSLLCKYLSFEGPSLKGSSR